LFKKLSIFGSQNNAALIFHRLVLRRVHFTNSNFAWGLLGGVDVKWSGGLFVLSCIEVIGVRVKVSRGVVPFSPMAIDSANTSQPPNGENWTNHIYCKITQPGSVPTEAARNYNIGFYSIH
jgi:hypothetical protein